MSDIEIINVGGVDYNIKDSTARTNAASAVTTANNAVTTANSKAPTSHASTATTYGVGNATYYGHVKLSDTYASNVGAAANSIGASQNALFTTYYNAYSKLQWQYLASYGGGATCPLVKNATYIGTGTNNIFDLMAFKYGRIGMIKISFKCQSAIPTYTDVELVTNIDFTPVAPVSSGIGACAATAWGMMWNYQKGTVCPINIVHDTTGTKGRLVMYVGSQNPIDAGDDLYGSAWVITDP